MKPGDVVLVKFPFANLANAKKRPALVLAEVALHANESLVTIAMITSQADDALEISGDVLIEEWESCGLLHPSLARLSKIATLDRELIGRKLGVLGTEDHKRVKRAFRGLYSDWI